MNCQEFLQAMDVECAPPMPVGWSEHAAACPRCALALRLERTLRSAPSWAEKPSLPAGARSMILRRLSGGSLSWRHAATLAQDSAVTALAAAALAGVAGFTAPRLWTEAVPEAARDALAPYAQPLLETARSTVAVFEPIAHQGWGVALLAATGFMVCFAAVLSTRVLNLRSG